MTMLEERTVDLGGSALPTEQMQAPPAFADMQVKEEASQPEDSVRLYLSEIGMVSSGQGGRGASRPRHGARRGTRTRGAIA